MTPHDGTPDKPQLKLQVRISQLEVKHMQLSDESITAGSFGWDIKAPLPYQA